MFLSTYVSNNLRLNEDKDAHMKTMDTIPPMPMPTPRMGKADTNASYTMAVSAA